MPARRAAALNALPIGLAHHIKLKRDILRDQIVTLDDVEVRDDLDIFAIREKQRAMAE